jgi:hypothetical protein
MKRPPKQNEDIWIRYCEDCINAKLETKKEVSLNPTQFKIKKKEK